MKWKPTHSRRGLTLVELLVVLAILALVTLVAVVATENVVEQGRYEVTQRTLENTQAAVLGMANQTSADGTPLLTGFVADLGRPPIAGVDAQIPELWLQGTLPSYRPVAASTDDPNKDVTILAGWRGPYLRMPPPNSRGHILYDGWGNPFALINPANNVAAPGDPVIAIRHAGPGIDAFTTALASQPATALTNNPSNLESTIKGSVIDTDTATQATNPVLVKLYLVDLTRFDPSSGTWTLASINPNEHKDETGLPPPYSFTFVPKVKINGVDVPATGNMVLRAWQMNGNKEVTTRSAIIRMRVPVGGMMQDVRLDMK